MSLIKWSPFFEPFEGMDKALDEMRSLQTAQGVGIDPPVDMYETEHTIVVETPVPGVDPGKIEVTVDNGILTIKGTTERKTEVEDKNYYRKEVRQGMVFRQIALPAQAQHENAEASFENGILKVTVPKLLQESKSIKIDVKKN